MNLDTIYNKSLDLIPLNSEEGIHLYLNAPLGELMLVARELRQKHIPGNFAGWMIDRNVNITNICFSQCAFCNFCRRKDSEDAYVTTIEEYVSKTDEMFRLGGGSASPSGRNEPFSWFKLLHRSVQNVEKHLSQTEVACTWSS